jgi:hypothetical protein
VDDGLSGVHALPHRPPYRDGIDLARGVQTRQLDSGDIRVLTHAAHPITTVPCSRRGATDHADPAPSTNRDRVTADPTPAFAR